MGKATIMFLIAVFTFCGQYNAGAQSYATGKLAYRIPAGWSQNVTESTVTYTRMSKNEEAPLAIKFFNKALAGVKHDSAFVHYWKEMVSNGLAPATKPRRITTESGLSLLSMHGACTVPQWPYAQLLVAATEAGMQPVLILTDKPASLRLYADDLEEFIYKMKEKK
jgi:hypothetical protein